MPVILTGDGSHSLLSEQFGAAYHSEYGAVEESRHVYIAAALGHQLRRGLTEINILEIGLGTGLNALLTLIESGLKNLHIRYAALEPFPPSAEEIGLLNYPQLLENGKYREAFDLIHASSWGVPVVFNKGNQADSGSFTLLKLSSKLEETIFSEQYDAVYFDAFGPRVQPELWTEEICARMFAALRPGGVLATFCAQGAFKRALKSTGFKVNGLPGPAGKREMTQAVRPAG